MSIHSIKIENFKSISNIELELGQVTVLIGENGCGKSNILEALALLSAAFSDRLDNELLAARGVRVTEPQFMRCALDDLEEKEQIGLGFQTGSEQEWKLTQLEHGDSAYSSWAKVPSDQELEQRLKEERLKERLKKILKEEIYEERLKEEIYEEIFKEELEGFDGNSDLKESHTHLKNFTIYSPENKSLRIFQSEGQLQPLGINGEGLLKLLRVTSEKNQEDLELLKEKMQLFDWFDDFEFPDQQPLSNEHVLYIRDRFIRDSLEYFDQRSANEGFLFLLFYFTLLISDETPQFFAIDNIDASLNPKLCSELMKEIVALAKDRGKQIIMTTHNPAILDGLNIDDPAQKLYVVRRGKNGETKVRKISKGKPITGQKPVKLSESFLRGYLGGLPDHF